MAKNLIIYFSHRGQNYWNGSFKFLEKGNTEICAEYIQKAVGGELFEIKTVKDYSSNYLTCAKEAKAELCADARPKLERYLDSVAGYDNIFVCGPCWWGTYPCAVFSLLDRLDFTGKTVIPLMTHEGSGLARASQALRDHCKAATVGKGLAVHGADAARSCKAITAWAVSAVNG